MQPYPNARYPWAPPTGPGIAPAQYSQRRPRAAATPLMRAARVQQACDQCRARKRRCDAMQPCDNCSRENHECVYIRSPNLRGDNLVNLVTAVSEKLERVAETVQRVDRAHRTTHQLLFSESKDSSPAVKEHRTPAHNLLFLWPSIRTLVDAANIEVYGDYVARAEDRPLLDPFARAPDSRLPSEQPEGHEQIAMAQRAESVPRTRGRQLHGAQWTQQRGMCNEGGLTSDGVLDLRRSTIETLLASYLSHIHILHPFLNKQELRVMFDAFIETFSNESSESFASPDDSSLLPRTLKRKRSRVEESIEFRDTHTLAFHSPQRQRIENATVWLVLALGKICLHNKPLPEVFDGAPDAESIFSPGPSRDPRSGEASPSSGGSTSVATSMSADWLTPSHGYNTPHSYDSAPNGWQQSSSAVSRRNLDVVPGLAYYVAATEILGSQADGTSLAHAQMFALAGLYKGQLARVRESISWISKSGQIVRLLHQSEGLFNSSPVPVAPSSVSNPTRNRPTDRKEAYRDAIKLTAWSALQLESDILAELSFPSSGLPALSLVPYNIPECGVEARGQNGAQVTTYDHNTVVLFYSAQTFLRTRLNHAHGEIYGKLETDSPPSQIREMLRGHDTILTEWRTKLPPRLRWEDNDPPSSNILHARLRAKYWGARYMITRPFLDYVMHIMPYARSADDVERVAKDAQGEARDYAETRLLEAIAGMPRPEIWAAVESCIEAAMQSTVAFDGIPGRLVVTNIHGTAHAQFGNMLVLAATYQDERLKRYVPTERLRSLLDRTIVWLGHLAPISQTCKADCWILQRIRNSLFQGKDPSGAPNGMCEIQRAESEASCESEIAVAQRAHLT